MNNNVASLWPQSHESGPNGGHDLNEDFSSFLNFNDISLNLSPPFDTGNHDGDHTAMDTDFNMGGHDHSAAVNGRNNGNIPSHQNVSSAEDIISLQFHDIEKGMREVQHQQQFANQHGMHHGGMIPPTPTSMEMHGGVPQTTLHHMHPHMLMDRFNTFRDDPMIFTPLVSPAVTPLETEFSHHLPEYTMPGAFSPLTSPALKAYHQRSHMPNIVSSIQSAIDPSQSPIINKKGSTTRRKSTTTRNPARVVRESPSMKPQRKRAPLPTLTMPKSAAGLGQQLQSHSNSRRKSLSSSASQSNTPMQLPVSREVSENESVSPEPLPEVLMAPPPPRTSSISRSPQEDISQNPVTPASLMKLAKTTLPMEDIPPISMDTSEFLNRDIQRADISNSSSGSDTTRQNSDDNMNTPTMSANRTPSSTPSLKPSNSNSRTNSRQHSPLDSQRPTASVKKPVVRKRGSISSSPALQPKISPSIKPLLPQGMSPDASALLLASKSNYQNIVEGNHSHLGLQYPEHLSTNLTSKRTSHKIAEQGRRNRINTALAEMANLLPPQKAGSGSDGGSASGAAAREQQSKASTVEMAIDYIKQLKAQLDETRSKLANSQEELRNCTAASSNGNNEEATGVRESPNASN